MTNIDCSHGMKCRFALVWIWQCFKFTLVSSISGNAIMPTWNNLRTLWPGILKVSPIASREIGNRATPWFFTISCMQHQSISQQMSTLGGPLPRPCLPGRFGIAQNPYWSGQTTCHSSSCSRAPVSASQQERQTLHVNQEWTNKKLWNQIRFRNIFGPSIVEYTRGIPSAAQTLGMWNNDVGKRKL